MKKRYTNPKLKVVRINASTIVCASPLDFDGNGETDTMYGKQRGGFSDDEEEDNPWNE